MSTRIVTREEKAAMQKALAELGLYDDAIDGLWGKNSQAAMARWQSVRGEPATGIPTYQQMVALGATVPEVITVPRRSLPPGLLSWVLRLLPLFFQLLPKVNFLVNNPLVLALGRVNKVWIAAVVSFVSTNILLFFFGFELSADTQTLIVTGATAVITGLATWLVPNAAPPPVQALGLLNKSLARATSDEIIEYNQVRWPGGEASIGGVTYTRHEPDAPMTEATSLGSGDQHGGLDGPRTGY